MGMQCYRGSVLWVKSWNTCNTMKSNFSLSSRRLVEINHFSLATHCTGTSLAFKGGLDGCDLPGGNWDALWVEKRVTLCALQLRYPSDSWAKGRAGSKVCSLLILDCQVFGCSTFFIILFNLPFYQSHCSRGETGQRRLLSISLPKVSRIVVGSLAD